MAGAALVVPHPLADRHLRPVETSGRLMGAGMKVECGQRFQQRGLPLLSAQGRGSA